MFNFKETGFTTKTVYMGHGHRKDHLHYILDKLTTLLGNDKWFISGSFANYNITTFNDIDIYFRDSESYATAVANIYGLISCGEKNIYINENHKLTIVAYTDPDQNIFEWPAIQLVGIAFGGPQQIFDTMDINVCKKAILPDATRIQDITADDPLHVTKIGAKTISRLKKYNRRLGFDVISVLRDTIDKFIEDDSVALDYYTGVSYRENITNVEMVKGIRIWCAGLYPEVEEYLDKQIALRAPELVI